MRKILILEILKMAMLELSNKFSYFQVAWRRLGMKGDHFLTVGTFTWVRENNIQVDHKLEEGHVSLFSSFLKMSLYISPQFLFFFFLLSAQPYIRKFKLNLLLKPYKELFITIFF